MIVCKESRNAKENSEMTEVNQTAAEQLQITKRWLHSVCPTGLFAGKLQDGQPYLDDTSADKIGNYIKLNGGRITFELLNAAVTQLWSSLTWYASDPESANFRGRYAPEPEKKPYHNMSDETLRQAGLKRDKDGNVVKMTPLDISTHYELSQRINHTEDSTPKSPREVLRETARSILKRVAPDFNPYRDMAESLVVSLPKTDRSTVGVPTSYAKCSAGLVTAVSTGNRRTKNERRLSISSSVIGTSYRSGQDASCRGYIVLVVTKPGAALGSHLKHFFGKR